MTEISLKYFVLYKVLRWEIVFFGIKTDTKFCENIIKITN